MITKKDLNNKVSKLRNIIREEVQSLFEIYAKKGKVTNVNEPIKTISFKNNITGETSQGKIDHIVLKNDNDTVIFPEGNDLDPVKLSTIMSIDDLVILHGVSLNLEGIKNIKYEISRTRNKKNW